MWLSRDIFWTLMIPSLATELEVLGVYMGLIILAIFGQCSEKVEERQSTHSMSTSLSSLAHYFQTEAGLASQWVPFPCPNGGASELEQQSLVRTSQGNRLLVSLPLLPNCVLRKAISSYCVSFSPSVNWDSNTHLSLTDQANLRRKGESGF